MKHVQSQKEGHQNDVIDAAFVFLFFNFEQTSHIFLVFQFLTLNKKMAAALYVRGTSIITDTTLHVFVLAFGSLLI